MLNIITALKSEARPLISGFGLQHQNGHPLPVYTSDDIRLAISGVGKTAINSATEYLGSLDTVPAAWLNLGIAGHRHQPVGQLLHINRIIDQVSGWQGFPAPLQKSRLTPSALFTVEQPEQAFLQNAAYDMEGSAYYQRACQLQSSELVQCLKLVSDTPLSGTGHINGKWIENSIGDQLPQIQVFLEELREIATRLVNWQKAHPQYQEMLDRWHFTQTQQHQLRDVLRRWMHRCPDENIWQTIEGADNAARVIAGISRAIQMSPVLL